MDRVTAGPRGDRDDPLEAEVARRGRGGTDGIRLVRGAHVRRGPVDIAAGTRTWIDALLCLELL